MKYIVLFLLFFVNSLFSFTQDEINLLTLLRKNTQDTELIKKIDELLDKDKKHFKTSTYIKATCIVCATAVAILVSIEMIRMLLGNDYLLEKTKALYVSSLALLGSTKELQSDTRELRDSHDELNESVQKGIDVTGDLLEKVHEISDSRDIEERLARNDVALFKKISDLEERLTRYNANQFLSFSDALNITPPESPITRPRSRTIIEK